MQKIKTGMILLLCAALLCAAFGCQKAPAPEPEPESDAVLTVGDVPVSALVYRYQLHSQYDVIQKNNLYDRETYLSYVVNPSLYYPYPYFDTRTEEGMQGLCDSVLNQLALEAAAVYAATQQGYTLSIEDQSYIEQAKSDAAYALEEIEESYNSIDEFYEETGFDADSFAQMYAENRKASLYFSKLLSAYRETHEIDEQALASGYERIVRETFADRYTDGMYSQYLYHYITGGRSYPSLYIPDDAIFVRLFVHTDPNAAEIEAYRAQAEQDFNALYSGSENEFVSQGTVGDVAIAPKDMLVDGLYDAAKDLAIGEVGSMTLNANGKTMFYLFMRVEGTTGVVPIDRYPGVREMIVNQLTGTFCMDTLRALVNDPTVTVRNETLLQSIRPDA